jgi:hypothetical protein
MKEAWFGLTPMKRDTDPRELKGIYLYLCLDASFAALANKRVHAPVPAYIMNFLLC